MRSKKKRKGNGKKKNNNKPKLCPECKEFYGTPL